MIHELQQLKHQQEQGGNGMCIIHMTARGRQSQLMSGQPFEVQRTHSEVQGSNEALL